MCQELSKCSRLKELGLIHVENITPFGLKFIGSLENLEKLLLVRLILIWKTKCNRVYSKTQAYLVKRFQDLLKPSI
jgi:hypothetical protein